MPKIKSSTVAENRVERRRALLEAAVAIIAEGGIGAVTPRSVGERAGLARSSFYEYFPSKDDLLAAVAMQAFEEWARELEEAVSQAEPGLDRLYAYVERTLQMTADGKHTLATGLQAADLSPKSFDAIMAMHDTLTEPLRTLLEEIGIGEAVTKAVLVQGLVNAGMQLVGHGIDPKAVTDSINEMLRDGVLAGR